MVRDRRLRQLERFLQIADARLSIGVRCDDEREDAPPSQSSSAQKVGDNFGVRRGVRLLPTEPRANSPTRRTTRTLTRPSDVPSFEGGCDGIHSGLRHLGRSTLSS